MVGGVPMVVTVSFQHHKYFCSITDIFEKDGNVFKELVGIPINADLSASPLRYTLYIGTLWVKPYYWLQGANIALSSASNHLFYSTLFSLTSFQNPGTATFSSLNDVTVMDVPSVILKNGLVLEL